MIAEKGMAVALVCAALWGCAAQQRAETAKRAQTELVGISKGDLLACAGAPIRTASSGDTEVFTYVGGGDSVIAGGGGASSAGGGVATVQRRYCEVTFVIRSGRVEKVNYAGRTGGLVTEGEQCAFVVQNCIAAK